MKGARGVPVVGAGGLEMEQEWTEREWTDTHYIGDGETEE